MKDSSSGLCALSAGSTDSGDFAGTRNASVDLSVAVVLYATLEAEVAKRQKIVALPLEQPALAAQVAEPLPADLEAA